MASKAADTARQYEALLENASSGPYELRLFIAGMTLRSAEAVSRIKGLCEENLHGRYTLEIIDIYQQRELAQEQQIVAVPMLVKRSPAPLRRLIGDFSDEKQVLRGLDIRAD